MNSIIIEVKEFLPIKECLNISAEDKLLISRDNLKTYEICGIRVVFMDECIIGVGR